MSFNPSNKRRGNIVTKKERNQNNEWLNSISSWINWNSTPSVNKDIVTWCNFDKLEYGQETINCLVICYSNGFQIWNIEDKDDFKEILNKNEGIPVHFVKLLPNPTNPENDRPYALVYSEHQHTKPTKLFSISKNAYVNKFKGSPQLCDSKLYNIHATKDYIFLVSEKSIAILNSNFSFHKKIIQYPVSKELKEAALCFGSKWLAFPSLKKNLTKEEEKQYLSNETIYYTTVATDITNTVIASVVDVSEKIYNYIDNSIIKGIEHNTMINNDIKNNINNHTISTEVTGDSGGFVSIYDVTSHKIIHQFRAHGYPISCIAFDNSGSLLAVSSVKGNEIKIYKIEIPSDPLLDDNEIECKLMYRLYRGSRPAAIRKIQFSNDSKWVIAISSNQTIHLFAINPNENEITLDTHSFQPMQIRYTDEYIFVGDETEIHHTNDQEQDEAPLLNSVAKIKCYFKDPRSSFETISTFTSNPSQLSLLVIQSAGVISSHSIYRVLNIENPDKLAVEVSEDCIWDTCRKSNSVESHSPHFITANKKIVRNLAENALLNHIEMETFDPCYFIIEDDQPSHSHDDDDDEMSRSFPDHTFPRGVFNPNKNRDIYNDNNINIHNNLLNNYKTNNNNNMKGKKNQIATNQNNTIDRSKKIIQESPIKEERNVKKNLPSEVSGTPKNQQINLLIDNIQNDYQHKENDKKNSTKLNPQNTEKTNNNNNKNKLNKKKDDINNNNSDMEVDSNKIIMIEQKDKKKEKKRSNPPLPPPKEIIIEKKNEVINISPRKTQIMVTNEELEGSDLMDGLSTLNESSVSFISNHNQRHIPPLDDEEELLSLGNADVNKLLDFSD